MATLPPYEQWPIEKLTVKIIRERFWDPVTQTGRPIKFFSEQDFECNLERGDFDFEHLEEDHEWETMTPTGTLIIGNYSDQTKVPNWLSLPGDGPYENDGRNGRTFYYLESKEEDFNLQVGWCGRGNNDDSVVPVINNYMTFDALDGVDCWIMRE
jgi:hypothetical protein